MNKPKMHPPMDCCTDGPCESGMRNNYFEGKRLTPDSFRVEQDYLVERRRLLNRAIHGWGVVYGYAVGDAPADSCRNEKTSGRLLIKPGLALDECGRELLQVEDVTLGIGLASVVLLDRDGHPVDPNEFDPAKLVSGMTPSGLSTSAEAFKLHAHDEGIEASREYKPGQQSDVIRSPTFPIPDPRTTCWLLSVHYAEQLVGSVDLKDPCSCERREWDRVCETVRYTLRPIDCRKCCAPFGCELECDCSESPCCNELVKRRSDEIDERGKYHEHGDRLPPTKVKGNPVLRGGCDCLCKHLMGLQPGCDCEALCEVKDPCARVRVDLRNGVPLACVGLVVDECKHWVFNRGAEPCGPRRLVKRNDVLFDLIRGCDLTRISRIGWAPFHRSATPVDWSAFHDSFGEKPDSGNERLTKSYWVEFSRPVRASTVRADCFAMTVLYAEDEAGWLTPLRVPIVGVKLDAASGTPPGHITRATFIVDSDWVEDAVRSHKSLFCHDETWVEIEVLGDYIVDCNGQAVDANAIGLSPGPTGNGTPGDTFISKFPVAMAPQRQRTPQQPEYPKGVQS